MKLLTSIAREIVGMFVDDGSLALQALLLVAAVTVAVELLYLPAGWAAAALLLGCVVILGASVRSAARDRDPID